MIRDMVNVWLKCIQGSPWETKGQCLLSNVCVSGNKLRTFLILTEILLLFVSSFYKGGIRDTGGSGNLSKVTELVLVEPGLPVRLSDPKPVAWSMV